MENINEKKNVDLERLYTKPNILKYLKVSSELITSDDLTRSLFKITWLRTLSKSDQSENLIYNECIELLMKQKKLTIVW